MFGHWPLVIILEVLLQSYGVVWNVQHSVEVVGEHLYRRQHSYMDQETAWGFY